MTPQQLQQALHGAAYNGIPDQIREAVSAGADINTRDHELKTALHKAAQWDQPAAVIALLENGADPNLVDSFGMTPLQVAWSHNIKSVAEVIWKHGVDREIRGAVGNTLLHWAAQNGKVAAMEVLIAAGADLNARNQHDATPLHLAANQSQSFAVMLLLDRGANPNLRDGRGRALLYKACEHHLLSVIGRVIGGGVGAADVNMAANDGKTPLHLVLCNRLNDWVEPLLAAGADPREPMPTPMAGGKMNHQTPLGLAREFNADAQERKRVQLTLVAYGVSPSNLIKELQVSPLKAAAMAGLSQRAAQLIEQGESTQTSKRHKSLVDVARDAGFSETASVMQAALAKLAIDRMLNQRPVRVPSHDVF